MRTSLLAVIAAVLGLSACGGGSQAQSGTPRSFMRSDSAVTVLPNGSGRFTATQVITLSNDDGGATAAVVHLSDDAGSIASTAGSGGYQIQVTLSADGSSDAQAREALATMTVVHRDATDPGTLYLDNDVQFAPYNVNNANRTAAVAATLPSTLQYQLGEAIGAGTVSTSGLAGPHAGISSGSGTVTLSGTWDGATADSGSGNVTVSGDIASLQASTGSGNLQLTVPSMRNTQASVDSGSGTIDVTVTQGAGAGYDLIADTGAGTASVVVAGTTPNGTQSSTHAHFTSANYASSSPRIAVSASTGAGTATIHD